MGSLSWRGQSGAGTSPVLGILLEVPARSSSPTGRCSLLAAPWPLHTCRPPLSAVPTTDTAPLQPFAHSCPVPLPAVPMPGWSRHNLTHHTGSCCRNNPGSRCRYSGQGGCSCTSAGSGNSGPRRKMNLVRGKQGSEREESLGLREGP